MLITLPESFTQKHKLSVFCHFSFLEYILSNLPNTNQNDLTDVFHTSFDYANDMFDVPYDPYPISFWYSMIFLNILEIYRDSMKI